MDFSISCVYLSLFSTPSIGAPQGHEHLLVCHSCGRVSFFRGDDLNTLVSVVEKKTGYVVQEHWLQLVGNCKECQQNNY